MSGHEEKSEQCDSCGWETENLTETNAYARTPGHGPLTPEDEAQWAWLCGVCRSTMAGNAFLYPNQYKDADVLRTIAWSTNYIASLIGGPGKI